MHGTVLVGCADDEVLEAVELPVTVPFRDVLVRDAPERVVSVALDEVMVELPVDVAAVPLAEAMALEISDMVA